VRDRRCLLEGDGLAHGEESQRQLEVLDAVAPEALVETMLPQQRRGCRGVGERGVVGVAHRPVHSQASVPVLVPPTGMHDVGVVGLHFARPHQDARSVAVVADVAQQRFTTDHHVVVEQPDQLATRSRDARVARRSKPLVGLPLVPQRHREVRLQCIELRR